MSHKKQHYVPRSYLEAWCDPNIPQKQEPYVWMQARDGSVRKKSPANILTETDFYTIQGVNGVRNLVLEHGLAQLESRFARLRRVTLSKKAPLSLEDRVVLCAFTAAMQARTKTQRDHQRETWQRVLDMMDQMQQWSEQATPEERAQMASISTPLGGYEEADTMSYEDVQQIVKQPMQAFLGATIDVVLPILITMQIVIIETRSNSGFITSDTPCCWFDPEIVEANKSFSSPGIGSPTIEITLPISPKQLLYITHHRVRTDNEYLSTDDPELIEMFNTRTMYYAREYMISNRHPDKPKQ